MAQWVAMNCIICITVEFIYNQSSSDTLFDIVFLVLIWGSWKSPRVDWENSKKRVNGVKSEKETDKIVKTLIKWWKEVRNELSEILEIPIKLFFVRQRNATVRRGKSSRPARIEFLVALYTFFFVMPCFCERKMPEAILPQLQNGWKQKYQTICYAIKSVNGNADLCGVFGMCSVCPLLICITCHRRWHFRLPHSHGMRSICVQTTQVSAFW